MLGIAVRELIDLCKAPSVEVSTGGFLERVLTQGADTANRYIRTCNDVGFDAIEVSAGFIILPLED